MTKLSVRRASWKRRCTESFKATGLLELPTRRQRCRLCGQMHGFVDDGVSIVVRPHNRPRR